MQSLQSAVWGRGEMGHPIISLPAKGDPAMADVKAAGGSLSTVALCTDVFFEHERRASLPPGFPSSMHVGRERQGEGPGVRRSPAAPQAQELNTTKSYFLFTLSAL